MRRLNSRSNAPTQLQRITRKTKITAIRRREIGGHQTSMTPRRTRVERSGQPANAGMVTPTLHTCRRFARRKHASQIRRNGMRTERQWSVEEEDKILKLHDCTTTTAGVANAPM